MRYKAIFVLLFGFGFWFSFLKMIFNFEIRFWFRYLNIDFDFNFEIWFSILKFKYRFWFSILKFDFDFENFYFIFKYWKMAAVAVNKKNIKIFKNVVDFIIFIW